MIDYTRDLTDFARTLVLYCGELLKEKRKQSELFVSEKNGHSDIVTNHDLWVQQYLSSHILNRYPDHTVLGEEQENGRVSSGWCWIIDPIDGTTNYCQFGRSYAISVGIFYAGSPVYGFVLDVENSKLYEGNISGRISQKPCTETAQQGILHIGFKTMRDFSRMGADPYALAEQFRGVRYLGCASLELCGIAEEQAGFYVNSHLKLWDFAAAYAVLLSRDCHIIAAEVSEGSYFVCAFRSFHLYRQCEPFFPEQVRRQLQKKEGEIFHVASERTVQRVCYAHTGGR